MQNKQKLKEKQTKKIIVTLAHEKRFSRRFIIMKVDYKNRWQKRKNRTNQIIIINFIPKSTMNEEKKSNQIIFLQRTSRKTSESYFQKATVRDERKIIIKNKQKK